MLVVEVFTTNFNDEIVLWRCLLVSLSTARPSSAVVREAGCCTKNPGKGMDVKLSVLGLTSSCAVLRS